jgi:SPP1 gp7 family putative phage head morphogenesis protein
MPPAAPPAFPADRLAARLVRTRREMRDDYVDELARFWRREAGEFEPLPEGSTVAEAEAAAAGLGQDAGNALPLYRMSPSQRILFNMMMRDMGERWKGRFRRQAAAATEEFLDSLAGVNRTRFLAGLRALGITLPNVPMSAARADVLRVASERVAGLIRTIPEGFHERVAGAVRTCVTRGRDLRALEAELNDGLGITERRARMIARDQTDKVSMDLELQQSKEAGITQGIWQHQAASRKWRVSHTEMHGEVFDLAEGIYDPEEGRNVKPAELVNCRCTYRPVLPSREDLILKGLIGVGSNATGKKALKRDTERGQAEARATLARKAGENEARRARRLEAAAARARAREAAKGGRR